MVSGAWYTVYKNLSLQIQRIHKSMIYFNIIMKLRKLLKCLHTDEALTNRVCTFSEILDQIDGDDGWNIKGEVFL
jgi:hypothetical protein